MVQYCCAYGCKTSSATPGNSFFKFPLGNPTLLKEWLVKVKRQNFVPTKHSRLCQEHFDSDCFEPRSSSSYLDLIGVKSSSKTIRRLKPNVVPTLFTYSKIVKPPRQAVSKRQRKQIITGILEDQSHTKKNSPAENIPSTSGGFEVGLHFQDDSTNLINTEASKEVTIDTRNQASQTKNITKFRSKGTQTKDKSAGTLTEKGSDVVESASLPVKIFVDKGTQYFLCDTEDEEVNSEDPNLSFYEPSSDSETEDDDQDEPPNLSKRPNEEKKFIVFMSCLLQLFQFCSKCFARCAPAIKYIKGSMVCIESLCVNGHVLQWYSQPLHGKLPLANLLLSAGILFNGQHPTAVIRMFQSLNIPFISLSTYYVIQKYYLYPCIMNVWGKQEQLNIQECLKSKKGVVLGGDARCDSPGHCAKYGSYTLMNLETKKVITFSLVQSNEVSSSNAMELEGLKRCFAKLTSHGVVIKNLVTDRHLQIRKFLREKHPKIIHEFDPWHVVKSLNKNLSKVSKFKNCERIANWSRSISNHLYYCAAGKTKEEKLDRWESMLNHIANIHEGHPGQTFPKCLHAPLTKRAIKKKKWIKIGTQAHLQMTKIAKNKRFTNDIQIMSALGDTSSLEGYHAMLLKMAPKNRHFFYEGMRSRLALSALHQNENAENNIKKIGGENQCTFRFPKAKKGECVLVLRKEQATYGYIQELIQETIKRREIYPSYQEAAKSLEKELIPPPLSSSYQRPTKEELIKNFKTRFSHRK